MQHELKSAIRFGDFWSVFGPKGVLTLAWYLGALHAERIRQEYDSFPFLQITGELDSGRGFLSLYLWKLLGKKSLSFWAPELATRSGRLKQLKKASKKTVVCTPIGVATNDFDWGELRPLYDSGACLRSSAQNYETGPTFQGAVAINGGLPGPRNDSLSSRILIIGPLFIRHSQQVTRCSEALDQIDVENAGAFSRIAAQREDLVFSVFNEMAPFYETTLSNEAHGLDPRPAKNYGQLMALVDALSLLLQLTEEQHHAVHEEILQMIDFEWLPF